MQDMVEDALIALMESINTTQTRTTANFAALQDMAEAVLIALQEAMNTRLIPGERNLNLTSKTLRQVRVGDAT